MKYNRRTILIPIIFLLILSLLTACNSETTSPVAEGSGEVVQNPVQQELQSQEQPEEGTKEETENQTEGKSMEQPADKEAEKELVEASSEGKHGEVSKPVEAEQPGDVDNGMAMLNIGGSGVEKEIALSLDDLKAMQDAYFEDDVFSLNSYGTKEYFHFKGVKLRAVLEGAGLKKNASTVTFTASDGYKQEMTIEQALKEDYIDEQNPDKKYPVIIAWHENGEDYDAEEGAPFRLVIGQKEPEDVNKPQWVQNVTNITVD